MLVLFDTAAGFALFKVLDEGSLSSVDDLTTAFQSPDGAARTVKLKAFKRFKDTTEALAAATASIESQLGKGLKKFLKKQIVKKSLSDELIVADKKLGGLIKTELGIECLHSNETMELLRGIRLQLDSLLGEEASELDMMVLGLAHSLSRYKLKFSADKMDTMIVQAINLLDDLDKEVNNYAMRSREWYGWHFPEMGKIVVDNLQYCRVILKMGFRAGCKSCDFSDVLSADVEEQLKEAAERSMGSEITDSDLANVSGLCTQVIDLSEYRAQLFEYLQQRMTAIAPNLTVLVGELVGARLIAHVGSLMNLAKQPASTVQIIGAEKALFRALKNDQQTPKYGLIYHASIIGQTPTQYKGKISRVLAAKTALAVRVDALGDQDEPTIGLEGRATVENRLRMLEGGGRFTLTSSGVKSGASKHKTAAVAPPSFSGAADSMLEKKTAEVDSDDDDSEDDDASDDSDADESDDGSDDESEDEAPKKKKKKKASKKDKKKSKKKAKKRKRSDDSDDDDSEDEAPAKKKSKKKKKKKSA
eukprot:PLAT157.3.p1 GENE.PLAT157.3~~PLAT157.3.p1  ORF type:complete len:532 (+),score=348.89 PLAT157.3:23-1618(+)